MTSTTWKRISAGYYTNGADRIAHIQTDDDGAGYGAADYWVIEYADGSYSDPIATLRDAKVMAMTEDLMTPGEVAKAFGVYAKTVAAWADAGKLSYITTPGGHRRYLRADVEALLTQTPKKDS